MEGIYRIKGTFKHYDWGGNSFIPDLFKINNAEGRPFAEYWLGTHQQDECLIQNPDSSFGLLRDFISNHAAGLGNQVRQKNQLPYLLKILDVKKMLSIQVHPSKSCAKKEYERENAEGIPLDSPIRNYKDDNHKPELMVALNDFWLLHGFKPETRLAKTLRKVPELYELLPVFENEGYAGLYKLVMEMPVEEVNRMLIPLTRRILPLYMAGKLERSSEDFWAARAAQTFSNPVSADRGIFSIYFFNLLNLKKGEGIFQDQGIPHAYLEGRNVEIMASSDNVLRGGLTHKHIDVKELMKHIRCEPVHAEVINGQMLKSAEKIYHAPVRDFQLSVFELGPGEQASFIPATAEILLAVEGFFSLNSGANGMELKPGDPACMVMPGNTIRIESQTGGSLFRASVPVHSSE